MSYSSMIILEDYHHLQISNQISTKLRIIDQKAKSMDLLRLEARMWALKPF